MLAAGPVLAAPDLLDGHVDAVLEEITAIRHHLHQHPELGNRETETAALVAEHLRGLGMTVKNRLPGLMPSELKKSPAAPPLTAQSVSPVITCAPPGIIKGIHDSILKLLPSMLVVVVMAV